MTRQRLRQLRGVIFAAGALLVVVVLDIALPHSSLSASYALAAVLAAALTPVRVTAAVAAASIALSALSGTWNGGAFDRDWAVRLLLCAGLGVLAVLSASIRDRREQALRHMTVVAETAQRALLRATPRQVGPVALASRYVSATHHALVGGDLYEVAASPYGVRVLVGDVRGKGLEAVQLAGTVLGAFRRAAFDQASLPTLAAELDTVVTAVAEEEDFVTCLLAEFHLDGTVTLVNCGHHAPLLVTATGDVRLLDTGEPEPPLGLAPDPAAVTESWPTGARMLLYTDGLVEARNARGGFFRLCPAARALRYGDLDEALDALLGAVSEHTGSGVRDDLALLLLERQPA